MKRLVFDCETGPNPEALKFAPEFKAPFNYKDPEKIAMYIKEEKARFVDRAALDPMTGSLAAFASAFDNEEPAVSFNADLVPSQFGYPVSVETELVSRAIMLFERCLQDKIPIIGFNSKGFDLPFIFRRAFILGVSVPEEVRKLATDRYNSYSIDLMQIWLCGSRDFIGQSLKRIALACGIGDKSDDGKHFAEILKLDVKRAAEYAINDIRLTMKLADRLFQ